MSLSVLEVLRNAEMNIKRESIMPILKVVGMSQLANAIKQLENDSDANKEFIDEESTNE